MALSPDAAARLRRDLLAIVASGQALADRELRSRDSSDLNAARIWLIFKERCVEKAAKIRAASDKELLTPDSR